MKFNEIRKLIEGKKLVLPDFQRNFVWDSEKMKSLYASVLCRMPIGSVLTLKSSDKAFACKKIGAQTRKGQVKIDSDDEIDYLIDGQQRLTSLFAGVTTYYFTEFKNCKDDLASDDLKLLWFLKIPALENNDNSIKDFFHAKQLNFENKLDESLSSSDVKEMIESKKISEIEPARKELFDFQNTEDRQKIVDFCTTNHGGFYRIPLQFVMDENETVEIKNSFRKILAIIAEQFYSEATGSKKLTDEEKDNLKQNWIDSVKSYFKDSLNELALNKIEVKNSNKARAIDIYSNLNMQGVALDVFDLIMAKVGKLTDKNFYEMMIDYIGKTMTYNAELLSSNVQNWIKFSKKEYNNPAEIAKVVSDKDIIEQTYINVFLNVLALVIAKKNRKSGDVFNPDVIKKEKILNLKEQDIFDNAEKCCLGMNRALFFFQTRCGIRKLGDINYKAQVAVVAYFFSEDKYFTDKKIHDFFEYWYWISVFAWMYQSNQNVNILNEIPRFEAFFNKTENGNLSALEYLQQHQEDVLNKDFYSDEKTLTMCKIKETDKLPPAVMTNYICQFYLSQGYKDFLTDENLNFLYSDGFEIHHLLPLGENKKIGETTKAIRKNKKSVYNSPLNMVYITKKTNGLISDMDFSKYSQNDQIKKVLPNIGCNVTVSESLTINEFLKNRFGNLKSKVDDHISTLYKILKSDFS